MGYDPGHQFFCSFFDFFGVWKAHSLNISFFIILTEDQREWVINTSKKSKNELKNWWPGSWPTTLFNIFLNKFLENILKAIVCKLDSVNSKNYRGKHVRNPIFPYYRHAYSSLKWWMTNTFELILTVLKCFYGSDLTKFFTLKRAHLTHTVNRCL